MQKPLPCPVTVLGGYLGAGKTTVLNHLLRHAGGRRIAVVINDFGELNIDADLVEGRTDDMISIAGGCVCCGFGDDLLDTLQRLRDAPEPFDHVVIETSGVALPRNLRAAISLAPGLAVAATIVLADAESVRRQAADRYMGDTVRDQLESADLLLLTKCDLLPAVEVDAVQTWLSGQAPAPVLRTVRGEVPIEVLLGDFERTAPRPAAPVANAPGTDALAADAPPRTSRLLGSAAGTLRPPAHATARYDTAAFTVPAPVDPPRLAAALARLAPPLVRAKGLVPAADGRLQAVQLVGRRWSVDPAPAGAAGEGRLVAIAAGEPLDRDAVRTAIAQARLDP
ncbi:MAG TPA: GTP-binding protein [Burkholderiaceae bacterium]|nr:GTP-binding protein [Burkholderiaceae bacterium]